MAVKVERLTNICFKVTIYDGINEVSDTICDSSYLDKIPVDDIRKKVEELKQVRDAVIQ